MTFDPIPFQIINDTTLLINNKQISFSYPIGIQEGVQQIDNLIVVLVDSYGAPRGSDDHTRNVFAFDAQGTLVWRIAPPMRSDDVTPKGNTKYVGVGLDEHFNRLMAIDFDGSQYFLDLNDGSVKYFRTLK